MEDKGRFKLSRVWGAGIRDGPVDLVGGGGGGGGGREIVKKKKNCRAPKGH